MAVMPRVLKNMNLFVDGTGLLGLCDEVHLPDLRLKVDEHRGGGMDAPISIDMGMDKLELGFTMSEYNENIFAQFGLVSQNAVQVTFRGAMQNDDSTTPILILANGMYTDLNMGTSKPGDRNKFEAKIALRKYHLTIGARSLVEIDIDNFTRIIDGADQLLGMRACLGIA